jgi:photosystem II stability/assembly factor-like uncharacterized protein
LSGLHRYEGDTLWTHLGWKNVRNFGIAGNPKNQSIIFLACGNGALRTRDAGKNWKITTGWQVTEVLDVSIDHFDIKKIYIATAYGVWRTFDQGESWQFASEGLSSKFVQAIVADKKIKNRILVGGAKGLHLSENGADNWTPIIPSDVPILDLHQNAKVPKIWLAGAEDNGVLISRDNGNSWQFVKGAIAQETIYAVASDPNDPDRMIAGGFQTGVFVSEDGGKNWIKKINGLPSLNIHALIFDPNKKSRIFVGTLGAGVYYSDNLGNEWQYVGLNGAEIWDMKFLGE